MVRKHSVYSVGTVAWGVVVFGLTVLVYSGQAAPFLTPSMFPLGGIPGFIAFVAGLLVAGALVIEWLQKRAWVGAGRQARLEPAERTLYSKPDLVGTVDGRPVRVRTMKRHSGGGGDSESSTEMVTVVETDLDHTPEEGLVIGGQGEDAPSGMGSMALDLEAQTVGEFAVVGEPAGIAPEVVTQRARSALAEPDLNDAVLAGEASSILLAGVPSFGGGVGGSLSDGLESRLTEAVPGDADMVRTETSGVLLDAEEMAAQIDAVTAVAQEFEQATAS
jgi:hypothetical protein